MLVPRKLAEDWKANDPVKSSAIVTESVLAAEAAPAYQGVVSVNV